MRIFIAAILLSLLAPANEKLKAIDEIVVPAKDKIIRKREKQYKRPKAIAEWNFHRSLKDRIGDLDLKLHGQERKFLGGIHLGTCYLESPMIPMEITEKTFEVCIFTYNMWQKGGGVMTLQAPNNRFDSIVFAEKQAKKWISGSDFHKRTKALDGPEEKSGIFLHLIITYKKDGTVTFYRNGEIYGAPYKTEVLKVGKNQGKILFGLRHLPDNPGKRFKGFITRARFYNRALTKEQVRNCWKIENVTYEEVYATLKSSEKKKAAAAFKILAGMAKRFEKNNHQAKNNPNPKPNPEVKPPAKKPDILPEKKPEKKPINHGNRRYD